MERAVGRLTGEFYLTCHPSEEALVLASSCGKQRGTKGYWFGLNSRSVEANRCVSRPSDGFLGINCIISRSAMPAKRASQPQINQCAQATFCANLESFRSAFYTTASPPLLGFLGYGLGEVFRMVLCSLSLLMWGTAGV